MWSSGNPQTSDSEIAYIESEHHFPPHNPPSLGKPDKLTGLYLSFRKNFKAFEPGMDAGKIISWGFQLYD
jgi:hypothetical protein